MNIRSGKIAAYWVCTALLGLFFLSGGMANLFHAREAMEGMVRLGYPPHFVTLLGAWKILGAAAVLAPGLPRLKEWAYAGMFFELTGAAVAHAMVGDHDAHLGNLGHILAPLVLAALVVASWALRPQSRRFPEPITDGKLHKERKLAFSSHGNRPQE